MRLHNAGNHKNSSIHHIEPTAKEYRITGRDDTEDAEITDLVDNEQYSESVPDMTEEVLKTGVHLPGTDGFSKTIVERSSDVLIGPHDFEGTVASVGDDIISMRKSRESASDVEPYRDLKAPLTDCSGGDKRFNQQMMPRTLIKHIINSSEQTSHEFSAVSSLPHSAQKQHPIGIRYNEDQ